MARHPYPIHTIRLRQALSAEQLQTALKAADDKQTLRGEQSSCLDHVVQDAANNTWPDI